MQKNWLKTQFKNPAVFTAMWIGSSSQAA